MDALVAIFSEETHVAAFLQYLSSWWVRTTLQTWEINMEELQAEKNIAGIWEPQLGLLPHRLHKRPSSE